MANTKESVGGVIKGPESVDILNKKLQFHWTSDKKLQKILNEGIFSQDFGKRIKDKRFGYLEESVVFTTRDVKRIYMSTPDLNSIVGIAINLPETIKTPSHGIPIRVAPRRFIGLVIVDNLPIREDKFYLYCKLSESFVVEEKVLQHLERVAPLAKQSGLPIYGTSGNLYFPSKLMHEELSSKHNPPLTI
jgi:hypothetical protein